jgi:hypothetical protein
MIMTLAFRQVLTICITLKYLLCLILSRQQKAKWLAFLNLDKMEFLGKVSSRSIIKTSVLARKLTLYLKVRHAGAVILGSHKTNSDNQGQVLQASILLKSQIIVGL